MRVGCIAVGNLRCDGCGRIIKHPERYLVTDEEQGVEPGQDKASHYCVDCALEKGYARYREEKGQQILTFFPE